MSKEYKVYQVNMEINLETREFGYHTEEAVNPPSTRINEIIFNSMKEKIEQDKKTEELDYKYKSQTNREKATYKDGVISKVHYVVVGGTDEEESKILDFYGERKQKEFNKLTEIEDDKEFVFKVTYLLESSLMEEEISAIGNQLRKGNYMKNNNSKENEVMYYFYCEGDYTPIAFGTETHLIKFGDNVHDVEWRQRSIGYAKGRGTKLINVEIYDKEDLEKHKTVLTNYGKYKEFEEYVKEYM